jgi:Mg2+ and Co2+ transporter CorA
LQLTLSDSRPKMLWAKLRSKVMKGTDFSELLRTLRALHNISLAFINSYEGFSTPSKSIDFITKHSLNPSFAPFWLDAHCLSEDEARRIQRAFGFHSKTFSLLYSHSHGHNSLKYEREVCDFYSTNASVAPLTVNSDLFVVYAKRKSPK